MSCRAFAAVVFASLALVAQSADGQAMTGLLLVAPERVEINLFYDGATIDVAALVPSGYEAAVRLMARPERLELKRLGKRAGVLWMKVGDASFENIPAVYQVLTSAPLADISSSAERAHWVLGYDCLVPTAATGSSLRSELVGLKEHDGLFAVRERALRQGELVASKSPLAGLGDPPSDRTGEDARPSTVAAQMVLRGTFHLPAGAPAGDYALDLIGFREQRAVHLGSATLHVEQVGLVRTMKELAVDHGLTYGMAASLFAIIAGLVTGRLFRSRAEGH